MPKMKTKSSAKKRFRIVGGSAGTKIKRARGYHRHLLTKKSRKSKRNLRKGTYVNKSDFARIKLLLPYN